MRHGSNISQPCLKDWSTVTYPVLTHSHIMTPLGNKPFETLGKGEIARNEQFLLFPQ